MNNKPQHNNQDYSQYGQYYSAGALMEKLSKFAKKAGIKVVYAALLLYYVLQSKDVPAKEKAKIIGALGYLILPVDLIPDAIPVLGFTDDLTALLWAIHAVRSYITPEIEQQAKRRLSDWFGSIDEQTLNTIF